MNKHIIFGQRNGKNAILGCPCLINCTYICISPLVFSPPCNYTSLPKSLVSARLPRTLPILVNVTSSHFSNGTSHSSKYRALPC